MTLKELQEELACAGLPRFRAGQVFSWLHRGAESFQEMTDISKDLRLMLSERYEIAWARAVQKRVSKDGTVKYLFQLNDGELIE